MKRSFYTISFVILFFVVPAAYAQDTSEALPAPVEVLPAPVAVPSVPAEEQPVPAEESPVQIKIKNLEALLKSIDHVMDEITSAQKQLQSDQGIGREDELRDRIVQLSIKLHEMEKTFNRLSTDVEDQDLKKEAKDELNWHKELKELLMPLIRELKYVTSRPREIDDLRTQIDLLSDQLPMIRKALSNIDTVLENSSNSILNQRLKANREDWKSREAEVTTKLNIAKKQLAIKTGQKKTWAESSREVFQIFFKSRGRNLFFSFLAFSLTWLFLFYVHKGIQKISPFHNGTRSFSSRFFDMLFFVFTGVFSFIALMSVLYFYGDWVLLTIAVIFMIGVVWASKQAIPRVWNQAKLILNIGPVREGEVIIYNGLPYEVVSINLFSRLVNKNLDGGDIRLMLKDLLDYRSRPVVANEPWFPTRNGDWVRLNDGTHGKVIIQTPETVKLELLGGEDISYRTLDFLAMSPMNLSDGFRLWITFRIDYAHRKEVTTVIPETIERAVIDGLKQTGYTESINAIHVHFKEAGSNALNIEALADFNGIAGPDYDILQRTVQQICVDTCNTHNWTIPFQQVKIHMAEPLKKE